MGAPRGVRGWAVAALLATLVLGSACAGGAGPGRSATAAEQEAYDAALAEYQENPARGVKALESYIEQFPASPLADDAAWTLYQRAARGGVDEQAARWLAVIVDDYPAEDKADLARLELAQAALDRGDLAEGRHQLRRVRTVRLQGAEKLQLLRLQVELSRDPVERLGYLGRLRNELEAQSKTKPPSRALAEADEELRRVDAEITLILRGMSADQLERAANGIKKAPPAAAIRLQLAERALVSDDLERARRELDDAEKQRLRPEDQAWLSQLRATLALQASFAESEAAMPTFAEVSNRPVPEITGAEGSIGVVLPLSGRMGAYGRATLKGILLAARLFEPEPWLDGRERVTPALPSVDAGPAAPSFPGAGDDAELDQGEGEGLARGVRIVVRDSGGEPARAAAAVRALAEDADVRAIIGPIFSGECESAVRAANDAGVPIVTLSNREEVARESDWAFRLRTTTHDEVAFLVDYAFSELGARRFAVLYPKSRYGRGMREEYWRDVLARGGQITAVASYDPSQTDFGDSIRRMIGWELLTRDERAMLAERERVLKRARRLEPQEAAALREEVYRLLGPDGEMLPPVIDFDVLFIPDSHQRIEMLAPQLAYHEVTGVRLLGSSEWNDPDLVRIGRHHVSGAVISTPFFADSPYASVQTFVNDWRDRFASEPDGFGALGFDAANLVLLQLAGSGGARDDVRAGLLRVQGYPGVSGVTSMQRDGNARRRPYLLGVRRGQIVGLD